MKHLRKSAVLLFCAIALILGLVFYLRDSQFPEEAAPQSNAGTIVISEAISAKALAQRLATDLGLSAQDAQGAIPDYADSESTVCYRTIAKTLAVTVSYHPTLTFYCKTDERTSGWGVAEVLSTALNREDYGAAAAMRFSGTLYANLEGPNVIYYSVNGDFFCPDTGEHCAYFYEADRVYPGQP